MHQRKKVLKCEIKLNELCTNFCAKNNYKKEKNGSWKLSLVSKLKVLGLPHNYLDVVDKTPTTNFPEYLGKYVSLGNYWLWVLDTLRGVEKLITRAFSGFPIFSVGLSKLPKE